MYFLKLEGANMKINVTKLKDETRKLNQLTSDFEYNILNIYNIFNNL